jgi:hypothetical protein
LTQDNKTAPWILFEVGALAKGLTKNRVCTFLVDLKSADVANPLAQFNHTEPAKDSVWKLVQMINSRLTGPIQLDAAILSSAFDVYWPIFEKDFREALEHVSATQGSARTAESYLIELLENTRALHGRVATLETLARRDALRRLNANALRAAGSSGGDLADMFVDKPLSWWDRFIENEPDNIAEAGSAKQPPKTSQEPKPEPKKRK